MLAGNVWLYHSYDIIIYNVYMLYFYRLFEVKFNKYLVLAFFPILWGACIYNLIKLDAALMDELMVFYPILGSLLIFICCCLYFYEVINTDKFYFFKYSLDLWIIIGTLTFHLLYTPIIIFQTILGLEHPVFQFILQFSNILYYGCFILGFIINAKYGEKVERERSRLRTVSRAKAIRQKM